jgi:predicted PurR-regulated permease PerM
MAEPNDLAASGFAAGAREAWARRDRVVWTLVGLVILIAAGIWGFLRIFDALAPFVIGGFLAFLLRPLVTMLTKWKLSRGMAVLVLSLVLVALFVGLLALVIPSLTAELKQFAEQLPAIEAQVKANVDQLKTQFGTLPIPVQQGVQAAAQQVAATFAAAAQQLTQFMFGALGSAIGFGFDVFLGWIISIWLLLGGPEIAKWCTSILPPAWREDTRYVGNTFDRSFGGYIRGTIITMTITFLGCAVGFNLINLPYATAIALAIGLLDVIPFIGPILGGAIATLVALTVSPQLALLTLVVVLIVEQSVDSVISPIVMGDSVRLHPLAILLALTIGGALGGLFGVIVSIPASSAGYAVYMYFMRKNGILEPEEPRPEKVKKTRGKKPAETAA